LGKLHLGKLHRERAMIGRIFQAVPTQTDTTTVAFIYKIVQLGALKMYVATVEALTKKERQDETQFTTKINGFLSFTAH